MHVLVIGGGARAHAIAWKLTQSPRIDQISVAPGNGGTAVLAPHVQNVDIDATDTVSLLDYAMQEHMDLIIVGPEESLVNGLVDQFEAVGLRVFGPHRRAAMIEASKSYAKYLMVQNHVPTAPYEVFADVDEALDFLSGQDIEDMIIKADGLTRGKGIFAPRGSSDAEGILRALIERDALDGAGRRVVIEQRLTGEELSATAFTDGNVLAMMPPVREYRRLHNYEKGPSTIGMGAYAPVHMLDPDMIARLENEIFKPVLAGLQAEHCCFKGVLYISVTWTALGPIALEINSRMGDPAAQVVLPLLQTDLLDVVEACVDGNLDQIDLRWSDHAAVTLTLTTNSYPERDDVGIPVHLEPEVPPGVLLFHGGTRTGDDGTLITTSGRVMNVTGVAPTLPLAAQHAYEGVSRVHFEGKHYRTDISPPTR
ncbi:MAG TPA: phosphoribosylamine--glycine ligase [Aggregatilineaceae bacterium]|nr:phosphoribosylamine--glycine ligase [Aggregatilineaceae bacterium]